MYIHSCSVAVAKPSTPDHLRKTKTVPVRMTPENFRWIQRASERLRVPISVLLREGARMYITQLEQKDGPGKEEK